MACVAHAVSSHPAGLGSGWRAVLEALATAARDGSPAVAGQAVDALAPVGEALFRPAGHALLRCVLGSCRDCVRGAGRLERTLGDASS